MMTRTRAFLAAALIAAIPACTDDPDDADVIASALEEENGGLDMEDEAPLFGEPEALAAAEVASAVPFTDAMAEDAETVAMLEQPGAVHGNVALIWGQLPPDAAPEDYARDWSGRLSVNRGALIVRRTIRFEPATDAILPRVDRTFVDFESVTRPFADGVVLTIVDPTPGAGPLTLTYDLADGSTHAIDLASLLDGPEVREVDSQGDRIAAVALRNADACDHGFLRGRWRALRPGLGGLLGEVSDDDGALIGHVRGIWGQRQNGERVFFGKYIDADGAFRGIFAGHWAAGDFHGRWLVAAGERGRLDGMYRESAPGQVVGGVFLGRWAETSCAADIPAE